MASREASHGWALRVLSVAGALLGSGCAHRTVRTIEGLPSQAHYRTGFPLGDASEDLARALRAVPRIQVQGTYDVYVFGPDNAPTQEALALDGEVLSRAEGVTRSITGRAATAIVIASRGGRATLLATDHGITLPDSTFEYFPAPSTAQGAQTLERVAIKRDQTNTVVGAPFVEPFELLVRDPERDLALIGVDLSAGPGSGALPPLGAATGDPGQLSWGSLVYVVGHPGGYQMVTSAIVSRPVGRSGDGFLIDGLLNEGTSGSAILAVRGDTEQLEWVGIARAAAVRRESRLVPESEATPRSVSARPYEGRIFLREVEEIRYGIAFAIPMGEIRDFVRAHRSQAAAAGYPLPDW